MLIGLQSSVAEFTRHNTAVPTLLSVAVDMKGGSTLPASRAIGTNVCCLVPPSTLAYNQMWVASGACGGMERQVQVQSGKADAWVNVHAAAASATHDGAKHWLAVLTGALCTMAPATGAMFSMVKSMAPMMKPTCPGLIRLLFRYCPWSGSPA